MYGQCLQIRLISAEIKQMSERPNFCSNLSAVSSISGSLNKVTGHFPCLLPLLLPAAAQHGHLGITGVFGAFQDDFCDERPF